tara:strand:+ start:1243 stop:1557 length:315 start_codon:yes stop_codon:yes gene_type:complete
MPYTVCKVEGGYKVRKGACGCGCAGEFMSKKPLTRDTAEKQKKAIELSEFQKKKLSDQTMKKLKEHSKQHKGAMQSKHMKNMVKFMKAGDTFTRAHKKAVKLDR